jgi:hypothetical protein
LAGKIVYFFSFEDVHRRSALRRHDARRRPPRADSRLNRNRSRDDPRSGQIPDRNRAAAADAKLRRPARPPPVGWRL